ncbi:MAG: HEAT repeat domain-containing protein [Candidatus Omnitrophota bacterium]
MLSIRFLTPLVLVIDAVLAAAAFFLGLFIIMYSAVQDARQQRRLATISVIKKDLKGFASLDVPNIDTSLRAIIENANPSQFIEIARNSRQLLSQEDEKKFRRQLAASSKISELERAALSNKDKSRRIPAIICIGYAGSLTSLGILANTIFDEDEDVSYFSMLALAQAKTPAAAHILMEFLEKHTDAAWRIASLLESFPQEAAYEIAKTTQSAKSIARFWAVKILTKFKPFWYLKEIEALTADVYPDVRAASCECLAAIKSKDSKGPLIRCLGDDVWFVRMHAIRALSKILEKDAVVYVAPFIEDNIWLVRDSVKKAIIPYPETAVKYVVEALVGSGAEIKSDCIDVLVESGYIKVLLEQAISDNTKARNQAKSLLETIINTGIYFGLKRCVNRFDDDEWSRMLKVVSSIDKNLAEKIQL